METGNGKRETHNIPPPDAPPRVIYGVHPVLAALRQGTPVLEEVVVASGVKGAWVAEARQWARQRQIRFRVQDRPGLDRLAATTHHQGIVARMGSYHYVPEADLLDLLAAATSPPLVVVADGLQDPMNLGNLIRSAHAAGALALVIPKDRAVGVTSAVLKAAAGAAALLPVVRVTNLSDLLRRLQELGLWVMGAEAGAPAVLYDADLTGPLALVIGSEDKGLRPRVRAHCDLILAIPLAAREVGSLNAAVAGAVFLFEIARQRRASTQSLPPYSQHHRPKPV